MEFRILEKPGVDRVNPFKQYTRKRNGHAGQLFSAAICLVGADQTMYQSDVMLAGWGDTHDKGQWVRFWLDEEAERHPFAGFQRRTSNGIGQMFIIALVLLDTDGSPIDPTAERRMEIGDVHPRQRTPSQSIHLMVTGKRFVQWLKEKSTWTKKLDRQGREWTGELAKRYVKFRLGIESLSDLDHDPEKLKRFHEEIRRPFAKWNGEE